MKYKFLDFNKKKYALSFMTRNKFFFKVCLCLFILIRSNQLLNLIFVMVILKISRQTMLTAGNITNI